MRISSHSTDATDLYVGLGSAASVRIQHTLVLVAVVDLIGMEMLQMIVILLAVVLWNLQHLHKPDHKIPS